MLSIMNHNEKEMREFHVAVAIIDGNVELVAHGLIAQGAHYAD